MYVDRTHRKKFFFRVLHSKHFIQSTIHNGKWFHKFARKKSFILERLILLTQLSYSL